MSVNLPENGIRSTGHWTTAREAFKNLTRWLEYAMDIDVIKRYLLESLLSPPRWGGRHTEVRNIRKGLPSSITSTKEGQRLVDKAVKELINDDWLLAKKSTGEIHVSLNPRKKAGIMAFVLAP